MLERLHARLVRQPLLKLATAATRVLLAVAFLPSGLVKIMGRPFTTLPVTTAVGHFFDGFFAAFGYYRFVGAMQLLAAGLLLVPSTAALGAALYLPIILNIFAVTVAVDFGSTRIITGLMLMADLYLLFWDYDRWKGLLPGLGASSAEVRRRHVGFMPTLGMYVAAAVGLYGVTSLHLARLRHGSYTRPLVTIVAAAIVGIVSLGFVWRQTRTQPTLG
jgi:hypothetical protein